MTRHFRNRRAGTEGFRARQVRSAIAAEKAARFEKRPVAPPARELLDYWRAAKDSPEFVYFIVEDSDDARDVVKIGVARNPERRLATLQCANPRRLYIAAVLFGEQITEAALHHLWRKSRLTGEWFAGRDDVVAFAVWAGDRQVAAHEAAPDDEFATRRVRGWFDEWNRREAA